MKLATSAKLKTATIAKIKSDYLAVKEVAINNIDKIDAKISGDILREYLQVWSKALNDKDILIELVADESAYGYDLWQINPFTGIFSPKERWEVLRNKEWSQK
ncbi:MAG: hypothetical protein FWC13_09505 [Oscillospiraceae bacterium]|nr:hypothetical protein [Oscillospiraceae bacterium]